MFIKLRPSYNGRHFADDIFKCTFFNAKFWILSEILLKYIPYGLIDNMAALVKMMVYFTDAYMRHSGYTENIPVDWGLLWFVVKKEKINISTDHQIHAILMNISDNLTNNC